ncbi:MAG TPA: FAD-dependent oxidoreductase, partial [Microlunatus sp.]|nr:FAD-dependent oxidoreductase [Microlunatus sp.]
MSATGSVRPRTAVVVGAGMVGLATAWWLQQAGVRVTVVDRAGVAAGASQGNAGWLTPGMATPLPEPAVLRYGLRAVLSPSSPVYVPVTADPKLIRFLAGFVRNCTDRRWTRAMTALTALNRTAPAAFEAMAEGGVAEPVREARPFLAAFRSDRDARALRTELDQINEAGQRIDFELISGAEARAANPLLSDRIAVALRLRDQHYTDPGGYVRSLADAVRQRGGTVLTGRAVRDVVSRGGAVEVITEGGEPLRADVAVLATGAWLGDLAGRLGVRVPVQAGRGYSFSVPARERPAGPVYFPAQRVACTPLGDRLRIAGMMEFRRPEAAFDPRRIRAIVDAARP